MSQINIDPEKAITNGNSIITSAKDFKIQVDTIYSIIDDLKSQWTGTAASRYTEDVESFKQEYEDFGRLINDFGELLVAIGKDYQSLENDL